MHLLKTQYVNRPNDFLSGEADEDRPSQKYLQCLKERFGHSNFRPMQWKVISSILDRKQDNCVVMATGYGKSLCYQFPSVYLDTVTIVISPLISLMEDQVLSLTVSNINACFLGSAQKDRSVIDEVFNFAYNIVYVTPELITSDLGSRLLQNLKAKLTLIAVDEAHCISKWGHDFRPAFRSLACIRRTVPEVPILAMTATATEQVRNDIVKSLYLRNPQMLCTGFDRPNLEFNVRMKGNQGTWADIGSILQSVRTGSIIIYCLTRSDTEEIAAVIKSNGVNSAAYHAGLTINQRKSVHEDFVKDNIQVIVATIAFGMGIDKPDVRMVIHYGVSKDIESYYQEVGRAGRDGMPAKCIMFYSRNDFLIQKRIREGMKMSADVQKNLESLALKMGDYVNTNECRRKFLLNYFEGSSNNIQKQNNCCDNCRNNCSDEVLSKRYENLDNDGLYDFTKDAENLLKCIEVFNGYTGLQIPIYLLRGSKVQKLNPRYYSHPLYGVGKDKAEEWYKSLADLLERNGYLEKKAVQPNKFVKTFARSCTISLSKKAIMWLENPQKPPLKLKPQKDMYRHLKKVKSSFLQDTTNLSGYGAAQQNSNLGLGTSAKKRDDVQELVAALLRVRASLASSLDVMPYMIASNKALYQIAHRKPVNLDEMKAAKLDGFSDVKVTKFGPAFIKCILQSINFLPPDNKNSLEMKDLLRDNPVPGSKLSDTHLRTFDLWSAGKSIEEIAQIRGISASTVLNYMNELIKCGYCATKKDLRKLGVVDFHFKTISSHIPSDFSNIKLKLLKEACGPLITYDMIKQVISYHQVRDHLKSLNLDFIDPDSTENSESKNILDKKDYENSNKLQQKSENVTENMFNPNVPRKNSKDFEASDVWGSDSDIDFTELDANVEQLNKSVISLVSSPEKTSTVLKTNVTISEEELELLLSDIRKDEEETKSQEKENSQKSNSQKSNSSEKRKFTRRISPTNRIQYENSDSEEETKTKDGSSQESNSKNTKGFKRKLSGIQFDNSSSEDEKPRPRMLPGWLPASTSFQHKTKKKSVKRVFS